MKSLEASGDVKLIPSRITLPIEELNGDGGVYERHDPKIKPWDITNNMSLENKLSRDDWEYFELKTHSAARDYFASNPWLPTQITMRLPKSLIMSFDAEKSPGCTLGIILEKDDFILRHMTELSQSEISKQDNVKSDAIAIARKMLKKRCEIFSKDLLSMNPPMNYKNC